MVIHVWRQSRVDRLTDDTAADNSIQLHVRIQWWHQSESGRRYLEWSATLYTAQCTVVFLSKLHLHLYINENTRISGAFYVSNDTRTSLRQHPSHKNVGVLWRDEAAPTYMYVNVRGYNMYTQCLCTRSASNPCLRSWIIATLVTETRRSAH